MVTKTDKYLNKFVASQTAGDVKVLVQAPGFEYRFESENALPMHFIASSTKLYTNTLFLTIILMPFTYSITNGIGAGMVTFVAIKIAQRKSKEVSGLMWIIAAAFMIYFAVHPLKELFGLA